jgi:hypothetical protein
MENWAITIGFGSLWRAGLDKQASFLIDERKEVGVFTSRYSYFLYGYLATIPLGSAKIPSASGSSTVCSSWKLTDNLLVWSGLVRLYRRMVVG